MRERLGRGQRGGARARRWRRCGLRPARRAVVDRSCARCCEQPPPGLPSSRPRSTCERGEPGLRVLLVGIGPKPGKARSRSPSIPRAICLQVRAVAFGWAATSTDRQRGRRGWRAGRPAENRPREKRRLAGVAAASSTRLVGKRRRPSCVRLGLYQQTWMTGSWGANAAASRNLRWTRPSSQYTGPPGLTESRQRQARFAPEAGVAIPPSSTNPAYSSLVTRGPRAMRGGDVDGCATSRCEHERLVELAPKAGALPPTSTGHRERPGPAFRGDARDRGFSDSPASAAYR